MKIRKEFFSPYIIILLYLLPMLSVDSDLLKNVESAVKIYDLTNNEIERFLKISNTNIPIVTVSFAQTLDGSVAPISKERMNISSSVSFSLLHSLRAIHDGILVGINTVIADNPLLNVRTPLPGIPSKSPRPIIIDSNLRIYGVSPTIRFLNPIICTTMKSDDELWVKTITKYSDLNHPIELMNCATGSDGRYY